MTYAEREINSTNNEPLLNSEPLLINPTEYHDRVRWGPVFGGLAVALATQMVLSSLGAALGFSTIANSGAPRSDTPEVSAAVAIWAIASIFISLFVGGWFTSRTSGPISKGSALLNGAILWAATLTLGSYLLASGVSGAFGIAASNAGEVYQETQQGNVNLPTSLPNLSAQQTRDLADNGAKAGWAFTLAALAGLGAALAGSATGVDKRHKDHVRPNPVSDNRV